MPSTIFFLVLITLFLYHHFTCRSCRLKAANRARKETLQSAYEWLWNRVKACL